MVKGTVYLSNVVNNFKMKVLSLFQHTQKMFKYWVSFRVHVYLENVFADLEIKTAVPALRLAETINV